jgi:hypothetical protein
MAFLCVSQQGSSKTPQKLFGKSPCQKSKAFYFYKKVEGGNTFPCHPPPPFCCIAFLAVSLHEELKNTTKICPETRPDNLKKSPQKKAGR